MLTALDTFFESMAWPMTPPPAYGAFHILYTLIGFALCGILAWKLRNVGEKAFHWILFSVGTVLIISEVFKQFFYYFVMMDNRYAWGDFPFQLCSIPMYLCVTAPWLKNPRVQRGMYSFMVLYNLLGGAISFAEPSGLLHGHWFLTIHALVWHMLLVFIGLFICFSRRGGNQMGDYRSATCAFLALSVVAFALNCFVQFGLGENMNMFFVGPGNSPLAVFSLFSEWFGWYVNTFIYLFAVCLGAYLIFLLIYYLQNKELPRKKKQLVNQ
ncbi:MAG: hypothetical protein E7447_03015 [Ruminococcaceae bacterium]|nr:hypothetical protein [Oscillospiraceae bacterium]